MASSGEAAMPGRLFDALRRVAERRRMDGGRLTVVEVAKEAGVSRATAYRDQAFSAAFKHAVAEAAVSDARRKRRGAEGHRTLVKGLRRTIEDMANVIQALSLAYDKLEAEVEALRSEQSGGKVVPFRGGARGQG